MIIFLYIYMNMIRIYEYFYEYFYEYLLNFILYVKFNIFIKVFNQ
jgi:hypothetical protein